MILNFRPQFAAMVKSGEKRQTIRAPRKDGYVAQVGERVHLYSGLLTNRAEKLGEGIVTLVSSVILFEDGPVVDGERVRRRSDFAHADGFYSWSEMRGWFQEVHGLIPFEGTLYRWRLLRRERWGE